MEVVRTTVACECVYVRAMVIKALIWMQSPDESLDELKSIIASELSDPSWPAALVNDVLLTLHARFKVRMIFSLLSDFPTYLQSASKVLVAMLFVHNPVSRMFVVVL